MEENSMVGMLVRSVAGHDKGKHYIVIRADEKWFYAANGKERTCDLPKRKNRKHLQPVEEDYDPSVKERLQAGERVREEEIRKLIGSYEREYDTCQKRMSSKSKVQ